MNDWLRRIFRRPTDPTISSGNEERAELILNCTSLCLSVGAFLMATFLILKVIP